MRILLVTNYQPPHIGGIQLAAESLKSCWKELGHEVTWLSTDIPKGARASTNDNVRLPASNILQKVQCYTPLIGPGSYLKIKKLVKEHDVINVHSVAPMVSVAALYHALKQGKPTVLTQHVGVIPLKSKRQELKQQRYISRVAKWSVDQGAWLTFVGRGVRDWFVNHAQIPEDRIEMTPAGIDHHVYYYVKEEERKTLREKWGFKPGRFSVLFVGRFIETKGIMLLHKLIQACPDIHFTLVGNGPMQEPFGWTESNVTIHKEVTNDELRELYGCHDVLIIPSVGEGWPAVICQGMACGLPCIVSEEAFEGYQQDEDQFLVRSRDPEVLINTLREAADGIYPLLKERAALSAYAHEQWDWMRTARIYSDLYKTAMAEKTDVR